MRGDPLQVAEQHREAEDALGDRVPRRTGLEDLPQGLVHVALPEAARDVGEACPEHEREHPERRNRG